MIDWKRFTVVYTGCLKKGIYKNFNSDLLINLIKKFYISLDPENM